MFCYAIGNEIPSSIVRWHGRRAIERFLERLESLARAEDPTALFTYVNYPSTEYLRPESNEIVCFNVYLEDQDSLARYLLHLQNVSDDRPLLLAEVGLDSMRNGEGGQAEALTWQIRTVLQGACAGTFVFAWTDEWHRGGFDIEDWAFGLVDRERRPKPALAAVREAFSKGPLDHAQKVPLISVVICTYNGRRTIRECLEAVTRLAYPRYEVIVVNDGSSDGTDAIIREFDVIQIDQPNGGLSHARNVGMGRAQGDIVAYIDDDAWPDVHWLDYLAVTFMTTSHVGVGGPNLPPAGDGAVADCVANAPGGPCHVLLESLDAEHIPGCNMAFRRDALLAVEGFDERFRIAGDDVDLCWRLLENGGTLGFSPGAVVWHHRRNEVRTYLRQQLNYGRAEGMLEAKWPDKYNRLGHLRWGGRIYGQGHTRPIAWRRRRVDQGVWGSRLFQSMYATDFQTVWSVTLMPEWYLVTAALGLLTLLGGAWKPMFLVAPFFVLAVLIPLIQVVRSAGRARFSSRSSGLARLPLYVLTGLLHVLQPLARLVGRTRHALTPWRRYGARGRAIPRARRLEVWSETWRSQIAWLEDLEARLQLDRLPVQRGAGLDRYDIHAAGGLLGGARLLSAVEEHGGGRQMLRIRTWPKPALSAIVAAVASMALATIAGLDGSWAACVVLGLIAFAIVLRSALECSAALNSMAAATEELAASTS